MTEEDARSESRIDCRPEDQLLGKWSPDHLLHAKPVDHRLGCGDRDPDKHVHCRYNDGGAADEIELNAADVSLVGDLARQNLDRDRAADGIGRPPGVCGRRCSPGFNDGNVVGGEHCLGFGLGHNRAAVGEHSQDRPSGFVPSSRLCDPPGLRRFIEGLLVPRVLRELQECADRVFRGFVVWQAGLGEELARGGCGRLAHPAREDRLLRISCARLDDRRGRLEVVSNAGRAVHHQNGVTGRALGQDAEGLVVPLCVRVSEYVDGIAVRPGGGKRMVERPEGRIRELGEPPMARFQRVDGEDPKAAAIGENGQPVARDRAAAGERLGRIEQIAKRLYS